MFYGGVMGSFAVERFGTERLQGVMREEIEKPLRNVPEPHAPGVFQRRASRRRALGAVGQARSVAQTSLNSEELTKQAIERHPTSRDSGS